VTDLIFPRKRADGTFSVAIRYSLSRDEAITAAQDRINGWMERKSERDNLDVTTELARPPVVDVIDAQTMQVVFDCRSTSTLWKGLMVELSRELSTINGMERLGFWDLVTGFAHPASIEQQTL
jgi:hypothetical protein